MVFSDVLIISKYLRYLPFYTILHSNYMITWPLTRMIRRRPEMTGAGCCLGSSRSGYRHHLRGHLALCSSQSCRPISKGTGCSSSLPFSPGRFGLLCLIYSLLGL